MAKHYKTYITIFFSFVLIACTELKNDTDEIPRLYPEPLIVKLNTEEGYTINPLTGDSIQPIINRLDTITC